MSNPIFLSNKFSSEAIQPDAARTRLKELKITLVRLFDGSNLVTLGPCSVVDQGGPRFTLNGKGYVLAIDWEEVKRVTDSSRGQLQVDTLNSTIKIDYE